MKEILAYNPILLSFAKYPRSISTQMRFEASRFLLQYLHPDSVNASILFRAGCKTESALPDEIFTLQFGRVITPDISTDAPYMQSVYAVRPLV